MLSAWKFVFPSPNSQLHSDQSWPAAFAVTMSKPHSVNGSESEFEFIETPKAPTPTFEKFEECGVRTTAVSQSHF